jgi:hypothetical protein
MSTSHQHESTGEGLRDRKPVTTATSPIAAVDRTERLANEDAVEKAPKTFGRTPDGTSKYFYCPFTGCSNGPVILSGEEEEPSL